MVIGPGSYRRETPGQTGFSPAPFAASFDAVVESKLDWTTEDRDGVAVARPDGRVDEATANFFADSLNADVARAAASLSKRLVLDLDGIEYMSSRGLRALTLAKRLAGEHDVAIALARPNAIMGEILAISRYDKLFGVFDTIEDAVKG